MGKHWGKQDTGRAIIHRCNEWANESTGRLETGNVKIKQDMNWYRSVVVKKDLPDNLHFYPHLQYGHELWVMMERKRSRIQEAEMSFVCRVAGCSLRDRVRSSVTWEECRVEPLLFHIETSQHLYSKHVLLEGGPGEDPGHAEVTMSLDWPGNTLGCSQKSWRGKSECPCPDCCPYNK